MNVEFYTSLEMSFYIKNLKTENTYFGTADYLPNVGEAKYNVGNIINRRDVSYFQIVFVSFDNKSQFCYT